MKYYGIYVLVREFSMIGLKEMPEMLSFRIEKDFEVGTLSLRQEKRVKANSERLGISNPLLPLSLSLLCPPIWAVLHHLYMYMVAFLALRILYVIALVCFVFVPCSPPESLPGKDVLCRLLPRPLPSVCFLFFSFLFRPCSPPICFGETSSIL